MLLAVLTLGHAMGASAQDEAVQVAVHFVKARGRVSPKVFTVKRLALPARGRVGLSTSVSLALHTTRTPRPGRHLVDAIVNGQPLALGAFHVVARGRRSGSARVGRRDDGASSLGLETRS